MSTEVQTAVESGIDKSVKRQRDSVATMRKMNLTHGKIDMSKRGGTKGDKLDEGRQQRSSRKRAQSFAGRQIFAPYKKRKKEEVVHPTKFLLGGNIRDPLNLNSLQDEEVNRAMNAFTPESSPLPTPQHRKGEIEVIIPPDIRDPLNLAGEEDNDAYAASFRTTPIKKIRKKNKKKKQRPSNGSGREDNTDFKSDESKSDEQIEQDIKKPPEEPDQMETSLKSENSLPPAPSQVVSSTPSDSAPVQQSQPEQGAQSENPTPIPTPAPNKPASLEVDSSKTQKAIPTVKSLDKDNEKAKIKSKLFDCKDKIVSPVIPQPGAWLDRHQPHHRFRKSQQMPAQNTPKFKEQNKKFQYGNYSRYYGYRNPNLDCDPRLKLIGRADMQLFAGKDVLDIGCNSGHVTLSIARDFGARKVVGVDIDRSLIDAARANVRKYCSGSNKFPVSMPMVYGSLEVPGVPSSDLFPHNLSFVQGNYVLENDILVDLEQPQFDIILCLSVTKWLHLNWGDTGLKRVFKRVFAQLRPGGKFILEPQSWSSYKKKKNLTETTWRNFKGIKLTPNMFTEYLLSEIGFDKFEFVGAPFHPVKGFQRTIRIFTKGTAENNSTVPPTVIQPPPNSVPLESRSETPAVTTSSPTESSSGHNELDSPVVRTDESASSCPCVHKPDQSPER